MSDSETRANSRADVFRYLADDEADRYVAIMDRFASTPLSELSTSTVAEQLIDLSPDDVQTLLDRLVLWGNLRAVRGGFRASSLGGKVHRDATHVLRAAPTAEPERLGHLLWSLDALRDAANGPRAARARVAGLVTSIVGDHRAFTGGVADFYAELFEDESTDNPAMAEQLDILTSAINRYAPAISAALTELGPHLVAIDREQWADMSRWYIDTPAELRRLAGHAMRRLLPSTARGVDGSENNFSPRADLLRLASWFDTSSDTDAEQLCAAAFGAYPSRHLLLGPDEPDPRVGASTSWWTAEPIAVPVSLRERGDRVSRGRTSRLPDPDADRLRVEAVARSDAERADAAARELLDIGEVNGAKLSSAARTLVLEQLARLLAAADDPTADGEWTDTDLGFTLLARRGGSTVLHSRDGSVTVHDLDLVVVPLVGSAAQSSENTVRNAR